MAILPGGRVFFCEFKKVGKTPKKLQSYWQNWLKGLGFHAFWCNNYLHFINEVERIMGHDFDVDPVLPDDRLTRIRAADAAGLDLDRDD